jgi:hypothetical protein
VFISLRLDSKQAGCLFSIPFALSDQGLIPKQRFLLYNDAIMNAETQLPPTRDTLATLSERCDPIALRESLAVLVMSSEILKAHGSKLSTEEARELHASMREAANNLPRPSSEGV